MSQNVFQKHLSGIIHHIFRKMRCSTSCHTGRKDRRMTLSHSFGHLLALSWKVRRNFQIIGNTNICAQAAMMMRVLLTLVVLIIGPMTMLTLSPMRVQTQTANLVPMQTRESWMTIICTLLQRMHMLPTTITWVCVPCTCTSVKLRLMSK